MGYNLEPMETVLTWAEDGGDENSEFDMHRYAVRLDTGSECGTKLCLAGKAAHDAGYTFAWDPREELPGVTHSTMHVILPAGGQATIKAVAGDVMGLNVHESQCLFVPGLEELPDAQPHDEETFALDFLRHLIERAHQGKSNMRVSEVDRWANQWCEDYEARRVC